MPSPLQAFTEIGFDPDHNDFFFGVSSEIEYADGTEVRKAGFIAMKMRGGYIRIWLLKTVIAFGMPTGFTKQKKSRNNFKFVLGIYGTSS